MVFTLTFDDNFLLLILANCVRDESCREKLAAISPNSFIIQDAAVITLRIDALFVIFNQSSNKLRYICQSKNYIANYKRNPSITF